MSLKKIEDKFEKLLKKEKRVTKIIKEEKLEWLVFFKNGKLPLRVLLKIPKREKINENGKFISNFHLEVPEEYPLWTWITSVRSQSLEEISKHAYDTFKQEIKEIRTHSTIRINVSLKNIGYCFGCEKPKNNMKKRKIKQLNLVTNICEDCYNVLSNYNSILGNLKTNSRKGKNS